MECRRGPFSLQKNLNTLSYVIVLKEAITGSHLAEVTLCLAQNRKPERRHSVETASSLSVSESTIKLALCYSWKRQQTTLGLKHNRLTRTFAHQAAGSLLSCKISMLPAAAQPKAPLCASSGRPPRNIPVPCPSEIAPPALTPRAVLCRWAKTWAGVAFWSLLALCA
jgi:hypothetical protein